VNIGKYISAAAAVALVSIGLSAPAHAKKDVFSAKYLNNYCGLAQSQIANTDLDPAIVIYEELGSAGGPPGSGIPATGFIGSDALPFDGAEFLPHTVTQYVGYSSDESYAQTVMCKMKSWDALNTYYPDSSAAGSTCADVNQKISKDVIKQVEVDNPGIVAPVIVYDNWVSYTGQQWTDDAPAPTAYISTADGLLHVVGKELYVARTNPVPFIPPTKKGVDYCQTIAPDYLGEIIIENVQAPVCDAPPAYSPNPFAPIPTWNCQNP